MSVFWSTVLDWTRPIVRRIRQWLSLPDRRPITLAAVVLASVLVGAFGAAAGSYLGVRTLVNLPDTAALNDLTRLATRVEEAPVISREASPRTAGKIAADVRLSSQWDPAQARQRFAAAGWSVSGLTVVDDQTGVLYPGDKIVTYLPSRYARFTAESQGLIIEVNGSSVADDGIVRVSSWAASSPALPALSLAGMSLGLFTGWSLAATASRRIRPAQPAQRATVIALAITTALVLVAPTVAMYGNLVRTLGAQDESGGPVATVHSALLPSSYWPAAPTWLLPVLSGAGGLLAVVTLILAARSHPIHATLTPGRTARRGEFWEQAASAVESSIEAARVDRDAAQRLLFLSTYPDWTPSSLDRMRDQLIDAGVPADFLSTTAPSGSPGN
ncbi:MULTISPECIES: hypothetical protein [unclassified Micromonospora]|uniref:hypothetical protein n=1 Tax=unclassified Micromonospora TaxID=2617518 RepID=UPI002FEEE3E9